jgi:hypothetical protein
MSGGRCAARRLSPAPTPLAPGSPSRNPAHATGTGAIPRCTGSPPGQHPDGSAVSDAASIGLVGCLPTRKLVVLASVLYLEWIVGHGRSSAAVGIQNILRCLALVGAFFSSIKRRSRSIAAGPRRMEWRDIQKDRGHDETSLSPLQSTRCGRQCSSINGQAARKRWSPSQKPFKSHQPSDQIGGTRAVDAGRCSDAGLTENVLACLQAQELVRSDRMPAWRTNKPPALRRRRRCGTCGLAERVTKAAPANRQARVCQCAAKARLLNRETVPPGPSRVQQHQVYHGHLRFPCIGWPTIVDNQLRN